MDWKKKSNIRHFCLALFLCSVNLLGFSQNKTVFKGKIMDLVTSQPLESSCIHNLSTGTMTFCNKNGDFAILVNKTDTLIISHIGHELEMLILNDSLTTSKERTGIWLVVRAFTLRNVNIYAMKPYPLFIKDITKETPSKKVEVQGMEISAYEKASYDINQGNLLRNTPAASPITALYNRFSRRAAMERMYAELVQNEGEVMRITKKYNPEIVQRLTKLENEALEEFMVYCSFSYATLITSTDYEIENMIVTKFSQYNKENGGKR